jgi:hypothetical protein
MVGVRGCATAHSSQEAHTGGSVTAGASAGKNLRLRVPPRRCDGVFVRTRLIRFDRP